MAVTTTIRSVMVKPEMTDSEREVAQLLRKKLGPFPGYMTDEMMKARLGNSFTWARLYLKVACKNLFKDIKKAAKKSADEKCKRE